MLKFFEEKASIMDEMNLLDLTVRKLLKKFGKGNHKPGSGSAAAFQGILSSNLIVTVISLTLDPERIKYYKESKEQLGNYKKILENDFIPRLEILFEDDSVQFDKVIKLRDLRNKTLESVEKNNYEQKHLNQLMIATEIPIEIAKLCIDISKIAGFVFNNGFQSARGDSCVARSSSLSAIQGCISIIDLNLISFMPNIWTEEKRLEVESLTKSYFEEHEAMKDNFLSLQQERNKRHLLRGQVNALMKEIKGKKVYKDNEIEDFTSKLQNLIWKNKKHLWRKELGSPLKTLKPSTVFKKILGYQYCDQDYLVNTEDPNIAIAGVIDQQSKVVYVSKDFNNEERNFTAAHELGHAFLHNQPIIHRDRPSDGFAKRTSKNVVEYQADKFAIYFLMPKKQVLQVFNEWFGTNKFIINEDNCFTNFNKTPRVIREECKSKRGLALKLSSLQKQYNGRFLSISDLFNVSRTAMAIRLEELNLVEF